MVFFVFLFFNPFQINLIMLSLSTSLLIALPMAILLVALFFLPAYIARQNKAVFEYLKENHELMRRQLEMALKRDSEKTMISVDLQAYKRLALFLERINPVNQIPRISRPGQKAAQLQAVLLNNIREEYEHNMSQQLYVTNLAWDQVIRAKNEIEMLINHAASEVGRDETGAELAKMVITKALEKKVNPVDQALHILKQELKKNF